MTALETGLSRSDLLGLKWASVDLQGGWIRLPRRKTGVESLIPISTACREALAECRRRPVVSEYAFLTERAKPYSITTFSRYFRKAKRLAKFPPDRRFRIHDMRHTLGVTDQGDSEPAAARPRQMDTVARLQAIDETHVNMNGCRGNPSTFPASCR